MIIPQCVCHHGEQDAADHTEGLPSLLSVLNALRERHLRRIRKRLGGFFKADAVFPKIERFFCSSHSNRVCHMAEV